MNPLLHQSKFEHVFAPLQGKRVGFVRMDGNVGDRLIEWATEQLFEHFGIVYGELNRWNGIYHYDIILDQVDTLVFAGGGNLGSNYQKCVDIRRQYVESGLPITVFPQSLTDLVEQFTDYQCIYLREQSSVDLLDQGVLAPDLALGFTPPRLDIRQDIDTGIFIREDEENYIGFPESSLGDPAYMCDSVLEYLSLAARCRVIYTDRLHFAICALIAGSEVKLLPGSYYKNRSMYDTWLQDLGCGWCESADQLPEIPLDTVNHLFTSLAVSGARTVNWNSQPRIYKDVTWSIKGEELDVKSKTEDIDIQLDTEVISILDAIDGTNTVEKICANQARNNDCALLDSARDVQFVLDTLRQNGVVATEQQKTPKQRYIYERGIEVHIDPPVKVAGRVRYQATIRFEKHSQPKAIWFEIPDGPYASVDASGDAFLLACLIPAMELGIPLHISGAPVSAGLLENLYEYQMISNSWFMTMNQVDIYAESSESMPGGATQAVAAYSGGVDSTFTVLRQLHDPSVHWDFNLKAAIFVRGFDMYLSSKDTFQLAFDRGRKALGDFGIDLIPVHTNIRDINADWKKAHGICVAAALSLFNSHFSAGLLASTIPYKMLYPFGSNALTDRMMGSKNFKIIHDGAEFERLEKLQYLSRFPHALRNIRFCWINKNVHKNCGKCQKCIVTAILLRTAQLPLTCFDKPPRLAVYRETLEQFKHIWMNDLDYQDMATAHRVLERAEKKPRWYGKLDEMVNHVKDKSRVVGSLD